MCQQKRYALEQQNFVISFSVYQVAMTHCGLQHVRQCKTILSKRQFFSLSDFKFFLSIAPCLKFARQSKQLTKASVSPIPLRSLWLLKSLFLRGCTSKASGCGVRCLACSSSIGGNYTNLV